MRITGQKVKNTKSFFINAVTICAVSLALLGCATTATDVKDTDKALSMPSRSKALVYGITLTIPNEWNISGSGDAGRISNEEINKLIDSGKKIPVIDMYHPATTAERMDARMALFLTNSTKDFIPEKNAGSMTEEEFAQLAKNIMTDEHAQATKNKVANSMIEWHVYRTSVDGHMTIVQEGKGKKSSGGEMLVCYADIYLANGKGLSVRAMCEGDQPDTLAVIKGILNSMTINNSK